MTLRQTIIRSLTKGFVWMLLIPTALLAANVFSTTTVAERPLPAQSPVAVMENCAPANGGHVEYAVIQRLNSGAEKVYSQKAIDRALNDAVFGKDWANVRVIGFCK